MRSITPDYICGFVDGEGCFALSLRRDVRHERPGAPTYYSWKAMFVIVLRIDDLEILNKIKEYFRCGAVTTIIKYNQCRFQVSNIDDLLAILIPFFEKYELIGKKGNDFQLWAEAITILAKYKLKRGKTNSEQGLQGFKTIKWGEQDLKMIQNIYDSMTPYKGKRQNKKWSNELIGRSKQT